MTFEWDEEKAKLNRSKHGVAFAEAATVFDDISMLISMIRSIQLKNTDSYSWANLISSDY